MKWTVRETKGSGGPLILRKPVIAVTGSAGKTTTKEMIAAILRRRWTIFKTPYNMNFLGSTRKYARRIRPVHRAVVLEFGMLRRGNIKQHCRTIQPNYGVITNIGTAHIGNFDGQRSRLAMAKAELIRHMNGTGKVFLNVDCAYSRKFRQQPYRGNFAGKFVTVGIHRQADYRATNIRKGDNGIHFSCNVKGRQYPFFIRILGEHNIYNALFAIAVADAVGFPSEVIQAGLRAFCPQKRRLITYRLRSNVRVIDDTYSSNPNAAKAAIDALCQVGKGTNVAVLGSMLEMGSYKVKGHSDVGRHIGRKKVNYLYTLGDSARYIGKGAVSAGFPASRIVHCGSKARLHRLLTRRIKPGTTFLVKGSNRLKMNETVAFLRRAAAKLRREKKGKEKG